MHVINFVQLDLFLLLTYRKSRTWYLITWVFLVEKSMNPIRWEYTHSSPWSLYGYVLLHIIKASSKQNLYFQACSFMPPEKSGSHDALQFSKSGCDLKEETRKNKQTNIWLFLYIRINSICLQLSKACSVTSALCNLSALY